jgi:hypothetical protein
MGYEAPCTLRLGDEISRGRAILEQHDLIFRGSARLAIPLKSIESAVARDGTLTVRYGRKTAVFEVGSAARRWADRITNPPSRLDKLGVKPQMVVVFAGEKHADFVDEVRSRGARVMRSAPAGGADVIFYAVSARTMLDRVPELKHALKPNGALWVIRPKGSSVITESEVMAAGKKAGLVDVKVVSFSETHTAEKFVIPVRERKFSAARL